MTNDEILNPNYEIWFTPPPDAMIGIRLLNGVVTIYQKPGDSEDWSVLFTLPPVSDPNAIIDDFTRAEEGPPPPTDWLHDESIIEP